MFREDLDRIDDQIISLHLILQLANCISLDPQKAEAFLFMGKDRYLKVGSKSNTTCRD